MIVYKRLSGSSGVTHYEIGDDYIKVLFRTGSLYLYTDTVTGIHHVAQMKLLARQGIGLSTYISQHVKDKYATKLN
jgi:hypothetical protein